MQNEQAKSESLEFHNYLELTTFLLHEFLGHEDRMFTFEQKQVDSNFVIILVSENQLLKFKIKLLQILQIIKVIVYDVDRVKSFELSISILKFFKPFIRNSLIVNSERPITNCFLKGRYQIFVDLARCRIFNHLFDNQNSVKAYDKLNRGEMVYLTKFLGKKEIARVCAINSNCYKKYFLDNGFWMVVYNNHFKKTGFTGAQVNWKTAFFDKKK